MQHVQCTQISTMKQVQVSQSRVHVTCTNWTLSIRAELFEIQEIQKQKQMSIKIHCFSARRRLKGNSNLFSPPLTKTLQQKRCLQVSQEMAKTLKFQFQRQATTLGSIFPNPSLIQDTSILTGRSDSPNIGRAI